MTKYWCLLLCFIVAFSIAQQIDNSSSSKQLIKRVKSLKEKGKIDSSYYFLEQAKSKIFQRRNKDSILLYHTLNIELARFDNQRYLTDQNTAKAEDFMAKNSTTIFDKNILAYYLNRKLAVFSQYHFANQDTIQLALGLTDEILSLKDSINDKSIIAYTLNEKAQLHYYYINKDKGYKYFDEAFKYSKKNDLFEAQIDIGINLASFYERSEQLVEAIEVLEELYSIANEKNMLWQSKQISNYLSRAYYNNGEFEKAYNYKSEELLNTEKYNNLNTSKLIEDAEYKIRIKNKDELLSLKEKQISNARINLYLVSTILFLLAVVLIGILFYNKKIIKKNTKLTKLYEENIFLLSEANHRINNNLQLVVILISDQLKKYSRKDQQNIKSILSKVESISTLHRHLYKNEDKRLIEINKYLDEIIINFDTTFTANNIKIKQRVEAFKLPTDFAMYLGLLLTELCINSIKHAFNHQTNKIIKFEVKNNNNCLELNYQDNGSGDINNEIKPKLIDKICRQLKVNYTINIENGFKFSFTTILEDK